ncbi:uncharacterized protein LOC121246556 [Juglans microcarpa x Juglans regia]|uniref:uncharacterized protein LOC121246556 n=1 Tax=Juglans microcarpa x Juglans regia TaxID=2249226 RepID=UPI001B7DE7F1|nr:uncharacterized protein LOC121246556 [Juglans microcarpa x Juglans regia]
MLVTNFTTRRILIDNRSSADILFWDTFSKIGIDADQLKPAPTTLKGFTGDTIQPMGSITLPVSIGTDPHIATTMIEFLVVRTRSTYNAIIGRPTLNALEAITSTYHLKIKFLTKAGIGEVRGEQVLARECYVQELKSGQGEVSMVDTKEEAIFPSAPQK